MSFFDVTDDIVLEQVDCRVGCNLMYKKCECVGAHALYSFILLFFLTFLQFKLFLILE